jgi:hypothetical protein
MGRAILGGCGGMLACNRTHSHLTTKRLLALSFHSGTLMHAFVASPEGRTVDVGYTTNGELVAYRMSPTTTPPWAASSRRLLPVRLCQKVTALPRFFRQGRYRCAPIPICEPVAP